MHVTATPKAHQALLHAAGALNAHGASSADHKAYRIYQQQLNKTAFCRTGLGS